MHLPELNTNLAEIPRFGSLDPIPLLNPSLGHNSECHEEECDDNKGQYYLQPHLQWRPVGNE